LPIYIESGRLGLGGLKRRDWLDFKIDWKFTGLIISWEEKEDFKD